MPTQNEANINASFSYAPERRGFFATTPAPAAVATPMAKQNALPAAPPAPPAASSVAIANNNPSQSPQKQGQFDDLFLQIVQSIENTATNKNPYWDSGGLNVGYGYCVTQRLKEFGKQRVIEDLTSIGISTGNAEFMVENHLTKNSADKKRISGIGVSANQAESLAMTVRNDYRQRAKDALGSKNGVDVFDGLLPNQQSAIVYLSYNADISKFKSLVDAVRNKDHVLAIKNMTPKATITTGVPKEALHRAGAWMATLYTDPASFAKAVKNPGIIDGDPHAAKARMVAMAESRQKISLAALGKWRETRETDANSKPPQTGPRKA